MTLAIDRHNSLPGDKNVLRSPRLDPRRNRFRPSRRYDDDDERWDGDAGQFGAVFFALFCSENLLDLLPHLGI